LHGAGCHRFAGERRDHHGRGDHCFGGKGRHRRYHDDWRQDLLLLLPADRNEQYDGQHRQNQHDGKLDAVKPPDGTR
jgi:hypothetical protein